MMASIGIRFLKNIWNGLTGKSNVVDRRLTPISEENIKKNKIIKEQQKKIKSLEAQISKDIADKRKQNVQKQNIFDEIELVKELEGRSEEIKRKQEKAVFDFLPLFKKLIEDKKFKVDLCDADDIIPFDVFKTIKIMENGDLAIFGKSGELWSRGKNLREIIWKPESLWNQIRRRRILLPYYKDFKPKIDLENEEMPEISRGEDGEFNISEERYRKIRDMMCEDKELIHKLKEDKEHLEQTIADLRVSKQDEELAKKSWKNQAENNQTQLAIAFKNEKEAMSRIHQMDRELTLAQEQKLMADELKDKGEEIFEKLAEKLEDKKGKDAVQTAKDDYENMFLFLKENMPEQKIIKSNEEKERIGEQVIKRG